MTNTSLAEKNAREAGVILKAKKYEGWYLGYLVASSVEKGKGNGVRHDSAAFSIEKAGKVSAARFADIASVSTSKVLRYLEAWNRASDDLGIEHSDDLTPGYELDWLDEEWVEQHPWGKYYRTVNNPTQGTGTPVPTVTTAQSVREQVRANPQFAQEVAQALREEAPETQKVTAEQVREAVRTNPEVESAAREESFNRLRERARTENLTNDPTVPNPEDRAPQRDVTQESQDLLRFASEMKKAERALRDALYLAKQIEEPMTNAHDLTAGVRDLCNQIESTLAAGGIDAELAALLGKEN